MLRTILAGGIGAVAAVALAFLVVAVWSAVAGVPVPYEPGRYVYGAEGAQYGVLLWAFIGLVAGWPFPVLAVVGAVIGVLVWKRLSGRTATGNTPSGRP